MTKRKYQVVSEKQSALRGENAAIPEGPLLSPRRAFVVQFREGTDTAPPHFSGRAEHLVSGHATRFHSSEELLTFFTAILRTVQDEKGGALMEK